MHYFSLFIKFRQNQYFRHDSQFSSFCQYFVKNEIRWSLLMVISTVVIDDDDDDERMNFNVA